MNTEKITNVINSYRNFLILNWPSFIKHLDFITPNSREDVTNYFLQANQEVFVETSILSDRSVFLRHYGEGADFEPYARVYCPDDEPKYEVICFSKKNKILDYSNGKFINCTNMLFDSFYDGECDGKKPFELLTVYDDENRIHTFAVEDIMFDIRIINWE